jgi:hypothetical protein
MNTSLDYFSRGITRAFAKRQAEQTKQLAEQQEIQSVQEKLKQQLLTMAGLKAQIEVFKNTDNSITTTKSVNTGNTNTLCTIGSLSNDEDQYKQNITQSMIALIKQRKMK